MKKISVRFVERRGVLSVLEVITPESGFAVRALARVLEGMRLQVVRWETKLGAGRPIERLFVVEYDGAAISERRRLRIQGEVLGALEQMVVFGGLPAPLARRAPSGEHSALDGGASSETIGAPTAA